MQKVLWLLSSAFSMFALSCGAGVPQAPQLTAVEKMEGALMVSWTNKEAACETIEGERMMGTGSYSVAFTVPGEATNKHDATATQAMNYMYRLRCKKGGLYSPYSNEMMGNPSK
jgi:hypothetical protein